MRIRLFLASILLVLAAGSAQAMRVTWNFQDTFFDDETPLTGSFDFDASVGDASGFSNVNVSTQTDSGLTGQTYNSVTAISGAIGFTSILGDQLLGVLFSVPMTNSGGTIGVEGGAEIKFSGMFPVAGRGLDRGSIIGTAVALAEPAGLAIFGMGLILILALRRRAMI